jgi:hypothetical protein
MTTSVDFYHTEASKENRYLRDMFVKMAFNCFSTSTIVVSPISLSPTPSYSSAVKTSENTKQNPDDPELTDEGNIQMEYSSD